MNGFNHRIFWALLKQQRERPENSGLNGHSNPVLSDVGAVLHQLSYQANWEQVVVWVDYKLVDVEIDNANTRITQEFASHHLIRHFKYKLSIDYCYKERKAERLQKYYNLQNSMLIKLFMLITSLMIKYT